MLINNIVAHFRFQVLLIQLTEYLLLKHLSLNIIYWYIPLKISIMFY